MQKILCTTVLTLRETFQRMILFKVGCKQTFYFSFRKHRRAREKKRTSSFIFHHPYCLYFLSHALDGLWRENRESVNRLYSKWLSGLVLYLPKLISATPSRNSNSQQGRFTLCLSWSSLTISKPMSPNSAPDAPTFRENNCCCHWQKTNDIVFKMPRKTKRTIQK